MVQDVVPARARGVRDLGASGGDRGPLPALLHPTRDRGLVAVACVVLAVLWLADIGVRVRAATLERPTDKGREQALKALGVLDSTNCIYWTPFREVRKEKPPGRECPTLKVLSQP